MSRSSIACRTRRVDSRREPPLSEHRIRNQGAAVTYERADGRFYLRFSKCMRLGRGSCICARLQLIDAVSAR